MNENHDNQLVRRIVLPSGRSIEVVRFDDVEQSPPLPNAEQPTPLAHTEQPPPFDQADQSTPLDQADQSTPLPEPVPPEQPSEHELHVCATCDSELVQPVAWAEASDDRWELTLECPNCGWAAGGVYGQDQVDRFEENLDDGLAELLDDLQRLTQANMADEIDRFAAALNAGLILPEDF